MSTFIILTTGRSGSTFLIRYLRSCPDTKVYGEIFHSSFLSSFSRENGYNFHAFQKECCHKPINFIKKIASNSGKKNVGAKVVTSEIGWENVNNLFIDQNNVKLIFLYRKNLVKRYLSAIYGNRINKWHLTDSNKRKNIPPKDVDVEWLKKKIEFERPRLNSLLSQCEKNKYLIVEYEELFSNFDINIQKVLSYIGLDKPNSKSKNLPVKSVKNYSFVKNLNNINGIFGKEFGYIE